MCFAVLCHAVLCHAVLLCVLLCCAVLYRAVLRCCSAVLCSAVLCCAAQAVVVTAMGCGPVTRLVRAVGLKGAFITAIASQSACLLGAAFLRPGAAG